MLKGIRSVSPRRLCKQVALDSPPPQLAHDHDNVFFKQKQISGNLNFFVYN